MNRGKPAFSYNFLELETTRWTGANALAPGHHTVAFKFVYDGGGFGKGGTGTLSVDGNTVASRRIEHTIPFLMPWTDGMDVGEDNVTTVDSGYTVPNAFTGTIAKVTFHTGDMKISQAQRKQLAQALFTAAMGIQ